MFTFLSRFHVGKPASLCSHFSITAWRFTLFLVAPLLASCATSRLPPIEYLEKPSIKEMQKTPGHDVMGSVALNGMVIAASADENNLWLLISLSCGRLCFSGFVSKIDLTQGKLYDFFRLNELITDGDILSEKDGVWVGNGIGGKIRRINSATAQLEAEIPALTRNALGKAGGYLWVAGSALSKPESIWWKYPKPFIQKIDPIKDKVIDTIAIPAEGEQPGVGTLTPPPSIVSIGDDLWICDAFNGAVYRLDAKTNNIVNAIPSRLQPSEFLKHNSFYIKAFEGKVYLFRRTYHGFYYAGPWKDSEEQLTVWEIDPKTNSISETPTIITEKGFVFSLGEGGCWMGSELKDGITRCDPRTFRPIGETRTIGHPVYKIVAAKDMVWGMGWRDDTKGRQLDARVSVLTRFAPSSPPNF